MPIFGVFSSLLWQLFASLKHIIDDKSWSILINIDQYWSGFILTKVTDSVSKQLLWQVLINIDQYWSILINIDQYWSGLILTKVTDFVSKQLLWQVLINIDQYWSILINIDQDLSWPKSQTLFQNNYYDKSWSILIRTYLN